MVGLRNKWVQGPLILASGAIVIWIFCIFTTDGGNNFATLTQQLTYFLAPVILGVFAKIITGGYAMGVMVLILVYVLFCGLFGIGPPRDSILFYCAIVAVPLLFVYSLAQEVLAVGKQEGAAAGERKRVRFYFCNDCMTGWYGTEDSRCPLCGTSAKVPFDYFRGKDTSPPEALENPPDTDEEPDER